MVRPASVDSDYRPRTNSRRATFTVEGHVRLEGLESLTGETQLLAYIFNAQGQLLGINDVNVNGDFRVLVKLTQPGDVELVISPPDDPRSVYKSPAFKQKLSAKDWKSTSGRYQLNAEVFLTRTVWWHFRPVQIHLSGHIRKLLAETGDDNAVSSIKVEVFEVDREGFWWQYINRWWDKLLDRKVVRIHELVRERTPQQVSMLADSLGPAERMGDTLSEIVPQVPNTVNLSDYFKPKTRPNRKYLSDLLMPSEPEMMYIDDLLPEWEDAASLRFNSVGEVKSLNPAISSRLQNFTITSRVAPWVIFPNAFHSKELICETTTDENGQFKCWFGWSPFQKRKGRLRYDSRPDIILRVTQTIDDVDHIVYLDPYTSTRWTHTDAQLDLYLDNEEIRTETTTSPANKVKQFLQYLQSRNEHNTTAKRLTV